MRNILLTLFFIAAVATAATSIVFSVAAMGNKQAIENDKEIIPTEETAGAANQKNIVKSDTQEKLNDLITPRVLGNTDAPIRIEEFASLSCSHCAEFHTKTFPEIKEQYIDAGKAYLVFNDFPLNASALHGSMAARCIPENRYFDFIKLLFEKQKEWAFESNYRQILGQYASLLGLGKEAFEACMNDEELKNGLINNVKTAQERWEILSTPSFVINDNEVITGARGFETFKEKFDAILKSQSTE